MKTQAPATEKQEALKKLAELKKQIAAQEALVDSFTEKPVGERIQNYQDICDDLGISSGPTAIMIESEGFTDSELDATVCFAKAINISKVYRQGRLPKEGERRYYAWCELDRSVPSGLRFNLTVYYADYVDAASAAHLCFFTPEDAKDAFQKFPEVYGVLYGAKLILGM